MSINQLPRHTTYQRRLELFNMPHGAHSGSQLAQSREEFCPDMAMMTMSWAFAGVLDRRGHVLATR